MFTWTSLSVSDGRVFDKQKDLERAMDLLALDIGAYKIFDFCVTG